jgi:cyclophilin family peptidyl-prolyl cis-trans isomerase
MKKWVLVVFLLVCGVVNINAKASNPVVRMQTSKGDIIVELFADKAPITCKNFLKYAQEGFYDGTIFHRVISGFVIQGGGFVPGLKQKKTRAPIKNEADNGLSNNRGTLAMARTSVIDSATSQFFINLVDNTFLNHRNRSQQGFGYAVFGKVISGMKIVEAISEMKTGRTNGFLDVPQTDIVIKKVMVLRKPIVKPKTKLKVTSVSEDRKSDVIKLNTQDIKI